MSYKIITAKKFEKELKKLVKKYPSLKKEYSELIDQLSGEPTKGTPIGKSCYKIRISIASKGGGKSGGGRVITYITFAKELIALLSIYDKGEQDSISNKEILDRLKSEGLI